MPRKSAGRYPVPNRARRPLAGLALLIVALGASTACGSPEAEDPPAPYASIPELTDGVLDVIVFPMVDEPFVAPNLEAGVLPMRGGVDRFMGIDVDVMAAFAEHLGVEVSFLRLASPGFGDLIPALIDGQGDMIASALTITEERDQIIDFSNPYFTVSTVIVTRKDSDIAQISDLNGKIGVGARGGLPVALLASHDVDVELIEAEFQTGAYADVSDGKADFAIMESASARSGLAARPGLKIAFAFPERDVYGFAAREGSGLIAMVNEFLESFGADQGVERIITHHLGPEPLDP